MLKKRVTASQLLDKMNRLGFADSLGVHKEFKWLAKNLNDDEDLKGAVRGLMGGGTVLLCVTNQRIIFLDAGLMWGVKVTNVPLEKVNGVSENRRMMMSDIVVVNGADNIVLTNILKKDASHIVKVIQEVLADFKAGQESSRSSSSSSYHQTSVADELMKYKQLLDAGAINQSEFNRQKAKLLGEDNNNGTSDGHGIGV